MDDRRREGERGGVPAAPPPLLGRRSSFAGRLDQWVADARVDDAARQRSRERWLQEVAEQEATLAGVFTDLSERRAVLALATTGGRRHRGFLTCVGADFVAVRPATGPEVLVALAEVAVARSLPAEEPATGDRPITTTMLLAEVLAELAAERERVLVVAGDDAVAGELRRVGVDVVVLRVDGDPPTTAYVSLRAITEVALP